MQWFGRVRRDFRVTMNNSYFFKACFEDGTNKIIELDANELLDLLRPDIENYAEDQWLTYEETNYGNITDIWVDEHGYALDIDDFFKNYRLDSKIIEKKCPEHENEDIVLETLKKGTYEHTVCHLKSEEVEFKINYECEIMTGYSPNYDPYSDGD